MNVDLTNIDIYLLKTTFDTNPDFVTKSVHNTVHVHVDWPHKLDKN